MTGVAFAFRHRRLDSHTSVIAFEGHLDLTSAPKLKWVLVEELGAGRRRVVLDLSLVTFMDSTALGVIVAIKRNLGADAVLAVAAASPAVLRLFEITGLDRTFDLFPTVDAAVSSLQPEPSGVPNAAKEGAMPPAQRAEPGMDLGDELESSSDEGAGVRIALTGDAAVALGIAATAMPFSRSREGQAERWLRILSRHGDAAPPLAALGFADDPGDLGSERDVEDVAGRQTERDPVAIVTRHARRVAERRGAAAVRTSDLLAAVIEVYGAAFERALIHHGISGTELTERLGLRGLGASGEL